MDHYLAICPGCGRVVASTPAGNSQGTVRTVQAWRRQGWRIVSRPAGVFAVQECNCFAQANEEGLKL